MYTEEKQAADFILGVDETVLWAERRTPRWDAEKITISCAIVILGLLFVLAGSNAGYFYGLIILGGLLWLLHSMLRRETRTVYILTDKRALIVEESFWGSRPAAVSVPLQPLLIVSCKRRVNGRVDYLFVKYTEGYRRSKDGFLNISSSAELEKHLADLRLSLPTAGESRYLTEVPRPTPIGNIIVYYLFPLDILARWIMHADSVRWWMYLLSGAVLVGILLELRSFLRLWRQPFLIFSPDTKDDDSQ